MVYINNQTLIWYYNNLATYVKGVYRFTTYETNRSIAPPKIVMQRLTDYWPHYCNIQLLPELVYGIHVQYECSRIEFLLA